MPEGEPKGSNTVLDRETLTWFAGYFRNRIGRLVVCTLGASALSLMTLPALYLIKEAFDTVIPSGRVGMLALVGAAIIGIRLATSLLTLALRYHVLTTTKGVVKELRTDLLGSLYDRSRSDLGRSDPALIQAQIVQDSERVDNFSNTLIFNMLPAGLATVVLVAYLGYLNWQLLLLGSVMVPLIWWANRRFNFLVKKEIRAFQRSFEWFSGGVLFALRQMDLTRIRGFEPGEMARQTDHIEDLRSRGHRMAMSFAVYSQIQRTLAGIGGILILVVGGAAVARGMMTLGAFLTFYVAAGMLRVNIQSLITGVPILITGNESLSTLHQLVHSVDQEPYDGTTVVDPADGIHLENVHFTYGRDPVLKGVNLSLARESSVAIVGPNGAGKSTILHLILGFYRPTAGTLRVGDVLYDDIDIRELRRSIGVVPQHPGFFVGTALENITYGLPEATMPEVEEVVRLSLAEEVIHRLPQGYDTEIGESGTLLSGGEAQRLAIARALLGRPRLLVLDEPTNHLEHKAIRRLMSGLTALPERPALLLVSHDPDVVAFAEQVYRMDDGVLR